MSVVGAPIGRWPTSTFDPKDYGLVSVLTLPHLETARLRQNRLAENEGATSGVIFGVTFGHEMHTRALFVLFSGLAPIFTLAPKALRT